MRISSQSCHNHSKISPFIKFFRREQQKYLRLSSTGIQHHPVIICYCLSLAAKSSSEYDEIRYVEKTGTEFFMLPCRRRKRDYKNCGFNSGINKIKSFSENEKFVGLLMGEMKI